MQQIEKQYDEFVTEFGKKLGKVDVSFALQTMYLQTKIPDSSPKVELQVCYTPGTDLEKNNLVTKVGSNYGVTYFPSVLFEDGEAVFDEIVSKLNQKGLIVVSS